MGVLGCWGLGARGGRVLGWWGFRDGGFRGDGFKGWWKLEGGGV